MGPAHYWPTLGSNRAKLISTEENQTTHIVMHNLIARTESVLEDLAGTFIDGDVTIKGNRMVWESRLSVGKRS